MSSALSPADIGPKRLRGGGGGGGDGGGGGWDGAIDSLMQLADGIRDGSLRVVDSAETRDELEELRQRVEELARENHTLRHELHVARRRARSDTPDDLDAVPPPRRFSATKLLGDLCSPTESSTTGIYDADGKARFRLVLCTEDSCEYIRPRSLTIKTSQSAKSVVKMVWDLPPRTALIVKKPHDANVSRATVAIARWLTTEKGVRVLVEPGVLAELSEHRDILSSWSDPVPDLVKIVDFVICLGGDGTTLWASHLFPGGIPPVISFAMGSLGFLTLFSVEDFRRHLTRVLAGDFSLSLRARLSCRVVRAHEEVTPEDVFAPSCRTLKVLNEVVVDRGAASSIVNLDCYCNGKHVTKVQADGIIVATPTGSTAYSLSAGGSIVHPSVLAMLFTPISPHSLSFRPLMFSDNALLKIAVPLDSRCSARVALDGRNHCELERGDSIYIKVSLHPLPAICHDSESADWIRSVRDGLHWNVREVQKPLFLR